jgi:uncharacterized protein (TIGR02301 family)
MRPRPAILACALLLSAFAAPAIAQPAQAPADNAERQSSEAWYAEQLGDLANVLGGAHYLRILCEGRGDQRWREYMQGVISREPAHRARLIEGFNAGYRQEEIRFEDCDAAARQTEAELRARGLRIADALRARHAN